MMTMMDATEKMLLESARQGDARSACALLPWLGRFGWRKPNYWPLPCDDGKIKDVGDWDDFVSEIGEHLDYQQAEMVCRLIVLAVERCEEEVQP